MFSFFYRNSEVIAYMVAFSIVFFFMMGPIGIGVGVAMGIAIGGYSNKEK
ncbi:hypothetical protein [Mammaliicoccus sciuri]|nr:hypothetical protein [Mammaliicoccus sciuri]